MAFNWTPDSIDITETADLFDDPSYFAYAPINEPAAVTDDQVQPGWDDPFQLLSPSLLSKDRAGSVSTNAVAGDPMVATWTSAPLPAQPSFIQGSYAALRKAESEELQKTICDVIDRQEKFEADMTRRMAELEERIAASEVEKKKILKEIDEHIYLLQGWASLVEGKLAQSQS